MSPKVASIPLGIVVRRAPGATRWVRWTWKAVAVLPGAPMAHWKELRREGQAIDYHAATVPVELWASETEAYLASLSARVPSVYVVMRETDDKEALHGIEVLLVTASPYEAQGYLDSGEEIVERVPMPEGLAAFVQDFCDRHHEHDEFVKRKRDRKRFDLEQDGIGDPRIRKESDVYRAPGRMKEALH